MSTFKTILDVILESTVLTVYVIVAVMNYSDVISYSLKLGIIYAICYITSIVVGLFVLGFLGRVVILTVRLMVWYNDKGL